VQTVSAGRKPQLPNPDSQRHPPVVPPGGTGGGDSLGSSVLRVGASALLLLILACASPGGARSVVEIPADVLEDKIRGGLLGQIFGNLNGLPHEFKYIDEPGKVETYVPALPQGAFTDDDTDIEWVYVAEMERSGKVLVPPARIAELWRANLNSRIWCANLYARQLMDLGIEPPLTGRIALNPWATFNISAQFVSEAFGLVAPAMPQTAARIGIHYTHVAVDGEPIQTTQFFTAMIALAFVEESPEAIVRAGLAAVDPKSEIRGVVENVLGWWKETPGDWKATRRRMKEEYTRHGGTMRDRNGYELNTAAIVGALLHGGGDFSETLRHAFNFGWDSDCNAATCGAILGVVKGRRWMDARGWVVKDVYKNTCRDAMPKDETITGYGDKLVAVARRVILEQGGEAATVDGRRVYRIRREDPANVERLPVPLDRKGEIAWVAGRDARAAYLALCLGESERFAREHPEDWSAALEALKKFPNVLREVFNAPQPVAAKLQGRAKAAGLTKPAN
jgi:ADP-ribosylglycohydrolase